MCIRDSVLSPPLGDKTIAGSQYRPPTCMQTLPQIYLILACWCCSEHPPAPLDSPRASRAILPPLPSGLRFVIRACKTTVTSHQSACPVLILRSTFITREGVQPSPPPLVHGRSPLPPLCRIQRTKMCVRSPVLDAVGCRIPYTTLTITPHTGGAVFRARLLDNQEGANTERYVLGKLSARWFQTPTFLAPTLFLLVEISTMENRPRGGGDNVIIHRRIR